MFNQFFFLFSLPRTYHDFIRQRLTSHNAVFNLWMTKKKMIKKYSSYTPYCKVLSIINGNKQISNKKYKKDEKILINQ